MHSYETVSEALADLQNRGFTTDFNLHKNDIAVNANQFTANEFEIIEYYRFEGNSDPADEAVVYAIESANGIKGILVSGYGTSSDEFTNEMAEKLKIHH
jgi:hypothetical protein